ncbi:acyl-CoA thioesterase [Edaphobacillus lindanitolerans]|uniref:Acyl-CoA thioester hydrolase n=1 Tax=Edaphobacillus lindanitolerans TaxID=550447 RepID=A0A1U7PP90_9BACI|nr:thioesterase family protein [Edaphobacillus lindanitolerans]SIT81069.1 acyl-CoA thioester hydrolase [Edaphobacillus lindanitolerans]
MHISETTVEVRYAETDQMGVVYHANYLVWMEIGRTALIRDIGFSYAGLEEKGYLSPVIDLNISYKQPMRYGDTAVIRTWIEQHGRLRTTYGYEIAHPDGTVAATGSSVHTLVHKESFRPVALRKIDPEWEAKYIEIAKETD